MSNSSLVWNSSGVGEGSGSCAAQTMANVRLRGSAISERVIFMAGSFPFLGRDLRFDLFDGLPFPE
jgi:hypothetical protein